jgi:hypothetical protein
MSNVKLTTETKNWEISAARVYNIRNDLTLDASGAYNIVFKTNGISRARFNNLGLLLEPSGNTITTTQNNNLILDASNSNILLNTNGVTRATINNLGFNVNIGKIITPTSTNLTIEPSGNLILNSNVGIKKTPTVSLDISGNDAVKIPVGTTAERPTPLIGMMRVNTDISNNPIEFYNGTLWIQLAFQTIVATGGTITDVTISGSLYRVHTFTTIGSSSFQVTSGYTADAQVLIVGGGGAGGFGHGAGGGGGAVLYNSAQTLSIGSYSIVVGAGGSATTADSQNNPGNPSSAFGVTATGGGSGANEVGNDTSGRDGNGGSGANSGGGSYTRSPGTATAPIAVGWTVYAGNSGGSGYAVATENYGCGGGGGAGAIGGSSPTGNGGNGGNGVQININGSNFYWGGGGGGVTFSAGTGTGISGNGGLGGGGGGCSVNGTPGTGGGSAINSGGNGLNGAETTGGSGGANSGGGGGGGANENGIGGAGGSGIVIIRYRIY